MKVGIIDAGETARDRRPQYPGAHPLGHASATFGKFVPKIGEHDDPAWRPMTTFNYDVVAELFPTRNDVALFPVKSRRVKRPPLGYGRFARAAYAIRFAIEELPADILAATCLTVDEQIFDGDGIRRLYDSEDYPLVRRASALPTVNIKYFSRR